MKPISDPERAFVVIVGIEQSSIFDVDPLVGPIADAIRCFDWALASRVPSARIRLFVSPKPASEPLLAAWESRRGDAVRAGASEADIQNFLVNELPGFVPKGADGFLVIMWSGHGLIDQRAAARTRRLFYADSSPTLPRHMEVAALLTTLKTQRYAGFRDQAFVVDACASFPAGLFGGYALGAPTHLGIVGKPAILRQWVMLAASPGQESHTEIGAPGGSGPRSKFIDRLVARLGAPTPEPWADFRSAFAETRATFEGDDQMPVSWAYGDGDDALSDDGLVLLSRARTTRLARAVASTGLSEEALRAAFVAALRMRALLESHEQADEPGRDQRDGVLRMPALPESHEQALRAGLPAMVELLGEASNPDGGPSPLQRFALEAASRASALQGAEVLTWLRRGLDDDTVERELDERRAAQAQSRASVCFLLIDEFGEAGALCLHAWIFFAKDPVPVMLTDDTKPLAIGSPAARSAALGQLIGLALGEAEAKGIAKPAIVLEFALPIERIEEDVESVLFCDGYVNVPIGQRYAVVRRIAGRLRGLQLAGTAAGRMVLPGLVAWKEAASLLRRRFEKHGFRLVWMTPESVNGGFFASRMKAHPEGSCVGLEMGFQGGGLTDPARTSLQRGALPFACWSRGTWGDADTVWLEKDLGSCPDHAALQKIFELRRDAGFEAHPTARLVILWDDPARDPYAQQLQAERAS